MPGFTSVDLILSGKLLLRGPHPPLPSKKKDIKRGKTGE